MGRLMYVRGMALCAGLFACVLGCNDSSSDDDDDEESGKPKWVCFEGATWCWCADVSDGSLADSSEPEVLACRPYSCCLHDTVEGYCECEDLATDCQAEADTRPGTVVVPSCPPGDIDLSRCADSGVSCREDFLQARDLVGCCPGLTCQMNAEGVPVCL